MAIQFNRRVKNLQTYQWDYLLKRNCKIELSIQWHKNLQIERDLLFIYSCAMCLFKSSCKFHNFKNIKVKYIKYCGSERVITEDQDFVYT